MILPIPIRAGVYVVVQDSGRQLVDVHFHCRNVALRVGHFASKTMRLSRDIWSKVLRRLDDTTSLMPTLEILTDYVVCNSSLEQIRFGQVNIFVSFHIFKGLLLLYYCSVDTDLSTVLGAIVGYLYLNPYQGIIMWLHKSSFRKIDDS